MCERVDLVLGPGVSVSVDQHQEASYFSLRVAFSHRATLSTDVVVHPLFNDTCSITARERIPSDALLLLMDSKADPGWRRTMKEWATVRGFSTSRGSIIDYDQRARDHAEEYYTRTVWIDPKTGLMSLLRIMGEFRRLSLPITNVVQPGIHYDFMYGKLFVRISPAVWEELMQKAAKAYAPVRTVAGDEDILISVEAYADMLKVAR